MTIKYLPTNRTVNIEMKVSAAIIEYNFIYIAICHPKSFRTKLQALKIMNVSSKINFTQEAAADDHDIL